MADESTELYRIPAGGVSRRITDNTTYELYPDWGVARWWPVADQACCLSGAGPWTASGGRVAYVAHLPNGHELM
jgi:hypothetical protein